MKYLVSSQYSAHGFSRNAPYILGFRAIIYALAAGNATVLKGSEFSPRCFQAIGSVLKEAGLPDGVLNIITVCPEDAAEVTQALIENAAIKKINFTGSTAVGSIIASIAGKNLKPVLMELGGKASAIVLEDADIDLAANECAVGAFHNVGNLLYHESSWHIAIELMSSTSRVAKSAWLLKEYWSTPPSGTNSWKPLQKRRPIYFLPPPRLRF